MASKKAASVKVPTDDEVKSVANAMDVDKKLDWFSQDHDKQEECARAMETARLFIVGVQAVASPESVKEPEEDEGEGEGSSED